MNYLAHAYLSFADKNILLGNMISDFVKGRSQYDYPPEVQKGIKMHRYIDSFTDAHPATHEAKTVFRPAYRLYSGAFIDVVYDHFIATDRTIFPNQATLQEFAQKTYGQLEENSTLMPANFKRMFGYMQNQDWLSGYSSVQGINMSFRGLVNRSKFLFDSTAAAAIFAEHYTFLKDCYAGFWKDAALEFEQFYHNL